jgi:hypothetical protein
MHANELKHHSTQVQNNHKYSLGVLLVIAALTVGVSRALDESVILLWPTWNN